MSLQLKLLLEILTFCIARSRRQATKIIHRVSFLFPYHKQEAPYRYRYDCFVSQFTIRLILIQRQPLITICVTWVNNQKIDQISGTDSISYLLHVAPPFPESLSCKEYAYGRHPYRAFLKLYYFFSDHGTLLVTSLPRRLAYIHAASIYWASVLDVLDDCSSLLQGMSCHELPQLLPCS